MNKINSWNNIIPNFENRALEILNNIQEQTEKEITPCGNNILRAFKLIAFEDVKVVILGQDPYPTKNVANGLAFAVNSENKIPSSLRNIFKELNSDLNNKNLPDRNLLSWAEQGVLLLNVVLTTDVGVPHAHKGFGWENLTDNVIKALSRDTKPKVFMLWGNDAKSKYDLIQNFSHAILSASHPSPLSAYRGFFGCKHFSKANFYLKSNNRKQIDWIK